MITRPCWLLRKSAYVRQVFMASIHTMTSQRWPVFSSFFLTVLLFFQFCQLYFCFLFFFVFYPVLFRFPPPISCPFTVFCPCFAFFDCSSGFQLFFDYVSTLEFFPQFSPHVFFCSSFSLLLWALCVTRIIYSRFVRTWHTVVFVSVSSDEIAKTHTPSSYEWKRGRGGEGWRRGQACCRCASF